MKAIFRNLINISKNGTPTIPMSDLLENYQSFLSSDLKPEDPSHIKIYHILEGHFRDYGEMPSITTVVTKAERDGDEGVLACLKDAVTEPAFIGSNFKELLADESKSQNMDFFRETLQKTFECFNTGLILGRGKTAVTVKGQDAAIDFFNESVSKLKRKKSHASRGIKNYDPEAAFSEERLQNLLYLPHSEMGKIYTYNPTELVIIASRTGGGKTTRLIYEAVSFFKSGRNGLFFTLETPADEVYRLFYLTAYNNDLGTKIKLSDRKMQGHSFTKDEERLFKQVHNNYAADGCGEFKVADIARLTPGILFRTTQNYQHELQKVGKRLDYVIVDYVSLMNPDNESMGHLGATERINHCIRELKIMADELLIPVFTGFQINREGRRQAYQSDKKELKRPQLHHLAWANECENSADKVIFLHDVYNDERTRQYELIVAKARRAPSDMIFTSTLDLDSKVWSDGSLCLSSGQSAPAVEDDEAFRLRVKDKISKL